MARAIFTKKIFDGTLLSLLNGKSFRSSFQFSAAAIICRFSPPTRRIKVLGRHGKSLGESFQGWKVKNHRLDFISDDRVSRKNRRKILLREFLHRVPGMFTVVCS